MVRLLRLALGLASLAGFACLQTASAGETGGSPRLRVFYFGNSLTAATRPQWHADLGRSAGREWMAESFLGAGWQSWQHRNEVFRALGRNPGGSPESAASRGDLTLDQKAAGAPHARAQQFLNGEWDAIVIQVFGAWLDRETREVSGRTFEQPINVGDIAAISDLISVFLERNPDGRVFLYTVWPPMPRGEDRVIDGRRVRGAEFPQRDAFDYESTWLRPYTGDAESAPGGAATAHRTRDYAQRVVAGVSARFPALAASGRLREIPAGNLFLMLDRKMRAGAFPGMTSIKDFYTDIQHIRAGLANYTVAALFFAALFDERPDRLDWSLYTEQEKYGPDPHNDFGEVLPITAEQATLVHETIGALLGSAGTTSGSASRR